MALVVDAVFMNAGSSVTYPVLPRSWPMSTAFSPSEPTMIGRSISVPLTLSCARSVTLKTSYWSVVRHPTAGTYHKTKALKAT